MLDLKKLEEKLDLALANETSESLSNWLKEKRVKNFLQSLGEGEFAPISEVCSEVVTSNQKVNFEINFSFVSCSPDYLIAA
jgi:hypothetical protein